MPRLDPIDPQTAGPAAKPLLDRVQRALGVTPNMMRTMAQSPAALDAYLAMSGALSRGSLGAAAGEQIALLVAEENGCGYCAAAHTALGAGAGLSGDALDAARNGDAADPATQAALTLARTVVATRGHVADRDVARALAAGLTQGQVAEVVAHVGLNVFTNYFNSLADTELDFPAVRPTRGVATAAA